MRINLFLIVLTVFLFNNQVSAQEDSDFERNGRWIVETGAGSLGVLASGTGASFFNSDGETVGSLSIEAGKFLSEDFALQFKLNRFSSGGSFNTTTIGAGGKYYASRNVPIKVGGAVAITSGFGASVSQFLGNASVGYAVQLSRNILLEPNVGILYSDGEALLSLGASFALILGD